MNLKERYTKKANSLLGEEYEEECCSNLKHDAPFKGAEEELEDSIEAVAQDAINDLGSVYHAVSMQPGKEDYAEAIKERADELQKRYNATTRGR